MSTTTSVKKVKGGTLTTTVTDTDKGMKRIEKELKKINKSHTLVGWPGETETELVTKVAVNEFGSIKKNIPSRPFNRMTFDSRQTQLDLQKLLKGFLRKIQDGQITVKTALSRLGEYYAGRIKETIMKGTFTPNSPKTIAAKGSTRPLVDTGAMKNSVTHKEVIK